MESVKIALSEYLNNPHDRSDESIILRPQIYLDKISEGKDDYSKRISFIMDIFNHWLQVPDKVYQQIKELVVNKIYTNVIVLDDVMDSSTLRRGYPTAHTIHGDVFTVNSCYYSFFKVFGKLLDMKMHDEAPKICVEEILNSFLGQGSEIYWRDNLICPTEIEFMVMLIRKNGSFFKYIYRELSLFSEKKVDLTRFIHLFGLYFQILDDYFNLTAERSFESKGFCEDIEEGKFSLQILHALAKNDFKTEILGILKDKPKEFEAKKRFIELLENSGSFDYTRQTLKYLQDEMKAEIEKQKLSPNPYLEKYWKFYSV